MASQRWQHLVVEVKARFLGNSIEHVQQELDKQGALGWELVAVTHPHSTYTVHLFFKRQP